MTNTSDIRPDTIHGDTQAQSYTVFALSHLLGIKLMPRIRGIKDLVFHRPEATRNLRTSTVYSLTTSTGK